MVEILAELKYLLNKFHEQAIKNKKIIWFIFAVLVVAFVLIIFIWCYNLIFTYPMDQVSQITNTTDKADLVHRFQNRYIN